MTRKELLDELQEQARLLGMSAERELALWAKIDELVKILRALEAVDFGAIWSKDAERAANKARKILKELEK
jgi:hypothetical protein